MTPPPLQVRSFQVSWGKGTSVNRPPIHLTPNFNPPKPNQPCQSSSSTAAATFSSLTFLGASGPGARPLPKAGLGGARPFPAWTGGGVVVRRRCTSSCAASPWRAWRWAKSQSSASSARSAGVRPSTLRGTASGAGGRAGTGGETHRPMAVAAAAPITMGSTATIIG